MANPGRPAVDDPLRRILILVPHAADADPRVHWVTDLCRRVARTDVLALVSEPAPATVRYDGAVSIEEFRTALYAPSMRLVEKGVRHILLRRLRLSRWVDRFAQRPLHSVPPAGIWSRLQQAISTSVGGVLHALLSFRDLRRLLDSAIRARVQGITVPPRLVICTEVWTLPAGLELKRRYGTRVLYDSHEYTPHANLISHPLEQRLLKRHERRLIRQVDAVVTVTPQLARVLEREYGLSGVESVPNAAPLKLPRTPACARELTYPIRFLVQGIACPGRGFEPFLDGWRQLDDPRAILRIRCPRWSYVDALERTYADLAQRGRLEFLDAVKPHELIEAATSADVGVIPYVVKVGDYAQNLNHLYACPNKLSQYMQAGLAVLATRSEFVASRLERYDCGVVYDPEDPQSLIAGIRQCMDDLQRLRHMQQQALASARDEFHWHRQALPFQQLIDELFAGEARTMPLRWAA
jgi:glycosyltransferase involved in cell wall biosynthesis